MLRTALSGLHKKSFGIGLGIILPKTIALPRILPIRSIASVPIFGTGIVRSILGNVTATSTSIKPQILLPKYNVDTLTPQYQPNRSLIKFSLRKGKRKSSKSVTKRFFRLEWGGWIRTRCGRHKKMFKKSSALKRRLRQHVFVNSTQAWLLDSLVTKFWRRPKYYVDDPYRPYHNRDEYFATRKGSFKFQNGPTE